MRAKFGSSLSPCHRCLGGEGGRVTVAGPLPGFSLVLSCALPREGPSVIVWWPSNDRGASQQALGC